MKPAVPLAIRMATTDDNDFIFSLLPRLIESGLPDCRDEVEVLETNKKILNYRLTSGMPGTIIFIAEDNDKKPLGFIHVHGGSDYYYKLQHANIAELIVHPDVAGSGVGTALMAKAEAWAATQGFRWLTLSVFTQNKKARQLYKKLGYGEDLIKYVKELK